MTTIVFLSDIHGNLPALQAVAADLPPNDGVYVAGDLCADGANPAEVVDFLREHGWTCVMGNTDYDIVNPECNDPLSSWAREQLGPDRVDWLENLPHEVRFRVPEGDEVLVVHANPLNLDDALEPTMSEESLQPYLEVAKAAIVVFGHLHTPYTRPVAGTLLIDVSSVGHPKDHDGRSAYAVIEWDGQRRCVQVMRVPYDIAGAVRRIQKSGMPDAGEQVASLLKASY